MIGCTRCGAHSDGDELTTHATFTFPHAPGCGAGIGPIFILPDGRKATKNEHIELDETPQEIVEEKPKGKRTTPRDE